MKRFLLVLSIFLFVLTSLSAQKIVAKKRLGEFCFFQNGSRISTNELMVLMESDDQLYQLMDAAHSNRVASVIFGIIGGGMIGWELGGALITREVNWTIMGIGAGFSVLNIVFTSRYNKRAKQAVDLYNAGLSLNTDYDFKYQLKFTTTGNGLGLSFNF